MKGECNGMTCIYHKNYAGRQPRYGNDKAYCRSCECLFLPPMPAKCPCCNNNLSRTARNNKARALRLVVRS